MDRAEPAARLISIRQVMDALGVSRATVYRLMDMDGFPRPAAVRGCARWIESEVQAWIEARSRARQEPGRGGIRVLEFSAAQVAAIERMARPGERAEEVILRWARAAASGRGSAPTSPSSPGAR